MNGTVETVINVASQGQALVTGTIPQGGQTVAEPFLVRLVLNDPTELEGIKPGTVGTVAIYTESVAATHVIRRVMMRMEAILNYLRPGL